MAIDSKRIAKNTIFLYARLILVLGVTLYTSRVVLDKLGVDDYGLYNVVFGVIGLLSFLNGTLSAGTSRFITFDLGRNDKEKLKYTFSTTLCTHLLLAGIILVLGETVGIWYVHNVMVCPPDRFQAAFIVYQISIIATIVSIIQVPFTSEIMAHEEMDIYAYIGIYEAFAKLVIVYLLIHSPFDRLIYYASLVAIVSISVFLIYVYFCRKKFEEVRFKILFDKKTFKEILSFSGWNIIANLSNTLMLQGVIMLFNLFFLPVVVAAQAISNQISQALMQFVNNVRQAVNPQVIKLYADGKYADSRRLTFTSAEYVFDLLLLLGVPCIMVMPALLDLWLVEVPDYAVAFARLIVLQDILGNFSAAFYTPMVAANKIQKNSIASVFLCVLQFVLLFVLFKFGFGPLWARYLAIASTCLFSFVVKPYILWKDVDYDLKEIYWCIWRSVRVLLPVTLLCVLIYVALPQTNIWQSVLVGLLSLIVVVIVAAVSMEKPLRNRILNRFLVFIKLKR
jgi:O-antigen/teichoic acid export membrane protein